MRRFLILLCILSATGYGGYLLSQRPEIRALVQPAQPAENPLGFLQDLPEISPKAVAPKPSSTRRRVRSTAAPAPAPAEPEETGQSVPPAVNQVPNEDVARALLGILAARKLGHNISLSVSDETIAVYGEADSAGQLEQIREILEKARESRQIDTSHLTVR